jgi:cytochrome c-type biogenesis protein CcmI
MILASILTLMTAVAVAAVLWPLRRRRGLSAGSDLAVYRDQLDEIERDRAAGLIGAVERTMPRALRQRCLIHRCRNVLAKVPKNAQGQVKADYWETFDVPDHIAPGPDAVALYEQLDSLPGVRPGGLHAYDGHNHQESFAERHSAVMNLLEPVLSLKEALEKKGLPVPRLVAGGTPSFPVFARLDLPGLECSPGTLVLHDQGYGARYADLSAFTPAALLLTRVISRPTPTRVTFDLGYKAVASDPPAGKRCRLLDVPPYEPVLQNEEHFVIETPSAERFRPGDEVLAIPTHVCPTVALHRQAYVVEGGRVSGAWDVAARDRVLSV